MLPTLRCLEYGQVLIDEKRKLFLLCNKCAATFNTLEAFCTHLASSCICNVTSDAFEFGKTSKLCKKISNATIQYQVFRLQNDNATNNNNTNVGKLQVQKQSTTKRTEVVDLVALEHEIMDPVWFEEFASQGNGPSVGTRTTSPKDTATNAIKTKEKYKELVEAVKPFVQFESDTKNDTNKNVGDQCRRSNRNKNTNNNISNTNSPASTPTPAGSKTHTHTPNSLPKQQQHQTLQGKDQVTKSAIAPRKAVPLSTPQPSISGQALKRKAEQQQQLNSTCLPAKVPKMVPIQREIQRQQQNAIPIPTTKVNNMKRENGEQQARNIPTISPPAPPASGRPVMTSTAKDSIRPIVNAGKTQSSLDGHEAMTTPTTASAKNHTEKILHKLQNMGVLIKRTSNGPQEDTAKYDQTQSETMNIIKKLQSKGMNIRKIPAQQGQR